MTTGVITFTWLECCRAGCGVPFAFSTEFERRRRADHKTFHCPNGHEQYYSAKSDAERARERAELAETSLANARRDLAAERKQHAATKGQVTRLAKRAAAGMCSQCGRTFQNYRRHMETKHAKGKATE
jgi:hypothetical protein